MGDVLKRFLDWLIPTPAAREPEPVLLDTVGPAKSPNPELDERLRQRRGELAKEIVTFERTAAEIRLALSRGALEMRGHRN